MNSKELKINRNFTEFDNSSFLFANPSYISGMANVLDIGATSANIYNASNSAEEADYIALRNDWFATGNDLRVAIDKYVSILSPEEERSSQEIIKNIWNINV